MKKRSSNFGRHNGPEFQVYATTLQLMQSQMLYLLKLIIHMRTLYLMLLIGFSAIASAGPISFGLFADTPYTQWQRENLANLISEMNKESLSFVVHAGDIKNGSSTCNDTVYQNILETFQQSRHPFVYVPGDNEWTDCHHKLNTAYDPLERLEKLRSVFFSGESSLGITRFKLSRQSEQSEFLPYRENVRWEMGGILFVTVNLPGSRNNFFGTTLGSNTEEGPSTEFVQRSRANSKWMADAFGLARAKGIRGLVLIGHANPGFERFKSATVDPSYHDFLEQLRSETQSFNGEVVFVHGDTHNQHVDQPLVDSKTDSVVQNFTRVETFGSPYLGWIRGEADPTRPKVFNFTPRLFATEPGR